MADHMDDDVMRDDEMLAHDDDGIQHGIDDSPNHDAAKGAAIGGIGAAVTGAIAGSMVGPVGAVIGAVAGGVAGAALSGAAVAAVDQVDNDDNVTGVGDDVTFEHHDDATDAFETDEEEDELDAPTYAGATTGVGRNMDYGTATGSMAGSTGSGWNTTSPGSYNTPMGSSGVDDAIPGNRIPGVQTGGHNADGTPDTRGIMEKAADTVTGDHIDDKTGKPI